MEHVQNFLLELS
jgi:hypothetical protein